MKDISSATPNKAKGAAFQLIAINKAQKAGKKIIGIEATKIIEINGKRLRSRRYDYIDEVNGVITDVECKSWIPDVVALGVKSSLKGTAEHGEQLLVDLLDWHKKGFTGKRWEFDSEKAVKIFIDTVEDVLENDEKVRTIMSGHLGVKVNQFDDYFATEIINKLDDFVKVVN